MTDFAPERPAADAPSDAGRPASADSSTDAAGKTADTAGNIVELALGWFAATRERAKSVSHLAVAEAKLAAASVVMMAVLGVVAVICVLGAWGLLVAGIAWGLVQAGLPVWVVLLGLGAAHVLAAYLLWRSAIRLTRHLQFAATRAEIRPEPDAAT